jgi:hypothetical protein
MQIRDATTIQPLEPSDRLPRALPLWPLPLIAGLLPAIAVLLALALFGGEGKVAASCNPFIDDCISISRMAKYGLANQLFRVFVLPAAVLQMLTWFVAARALFATGLARREAFLLALLGVFAGVALVLYGSFLGSDGQVYRWLRRWGALAYFGGTYVAMLVFARASQRLHKANRLALPHSHSRVMLALLAFIAVISVFHLFVGAAGFADLEDRIENLTEWWGSVAMTLYWMTVASLFRRWGFVATIGVQRPGG